MPGLRGKNSSSAPAFCVTGELGFGGTIFEICSRAVSTWRQERYPGDSDRRTGGFETSAALEIDTLFSIFVGWSRRGC
jgi:hypothetical protein